MINMKRISILFFLLFICLLIVSCSEPVDIIDATHYERVPRPVSLTAVADTTNEGSKYVVLSWAVNSTNNLRNFEVYRRLNVSNNFASRLFIEEMTFTDTLFTPTDSIAFYYVQPIGIDKFIGRNSDTLQVRLK
jgi:hypothetical protein